MRAHPFARSTPMVSTDKAQGLSPEIRAGSFHFTVIAATGVACAYFEGPRE